METIKINVAGVVNSGHSIDVAKGKICTVAGNVSNLRWQIDRKIKYRNNIDARLNSVVQNLEDLNIRFCNIKSVVENGAISYQTTDTKVVHNGRLIPLIMANNATAVGAFGNAIPYTGKKKKEKHKNPSPFSWENLWKMTDSAGTGGTTISIIGSIITGGKSWKTVLNAVKGIIKLIEKVTKELSSGNSFDWKVIFGLNRSSPLSKPSDVIGKTFDDLNVGKAKNVYGKVSVIAKWAGHILTVMLTAYDNFTDKKENNSFERKIAETVGESLVKIIQGILLGGGIVAGCVAVGVSAPPVIAVAAGVTLISIIADAVCEKFTKGNKNFAEWVSDNALDGCKAVGERAKTVRGKINGWWNMATAK